MLTELALFYRSSCKSVSS